MKKLFILLIIVTGGLIFTIHLIHDLENKKDVESPQRTSMPCITMVSKNQNPHIDVFTFNILDTIFVDWGDDHWKKVITKDMSTEYNGYHWRPRGKIRLIYTYNDSLPHTIKISCNIKKLKCCNNQLTSLDISQCTELTCLSCGGNQLTSLDVSKNTVLEKLYCSHNQLTSLDVSRNTALEYLECSANQLTSLDVSKNMVLEELGCEDNQLTSLDISKNTALRFLNCSINQLSSLDVSNTILKTLYCKDNQFSVSAMNKIYNDLPDVVYADGFLYCDKLGDYSIAENKGWNVN